MAAGRERERGRFDEGPAPVEQPLLIGQLEEQLFEIAHTLSLD